MHLTTLMMIIEWASEWIKCDATLTTPKCGWQLHVAMSIARQLVVNLHIKFAQFDSSVWICVWQIGCNNTSLTTCDLWLTNDTFYRITCTGLPLMRKWIINFYIWWLSYLIYTCNYQVLIIGFQLFSFHFQLVPWWLYYLMSSDWGITAGDL